MNHFIHIRNDKLICLSTHTLNMILRIIFFYFGSINFDEVFSSVSSLSQKNIIFLGSSCVYPRNCKQPIKEKYLLSGKLEKTNDAYAVAKIAGIKMCESYNLQYKTNYKCIMPTNTFGPNDNYDSMNSHFVPALIKKCHDIKVKKKMNLFRATAMENPGTHVAPAGGRTPEPISHHRMGEEQRRLKAQVEEIKLLRIDQAGYAEKLFDPFPQVVLCAEPHLASKRR